MENNDIIKYVKENVSASATLRSLGLRPAGGNFKTLYKKIDELGIDNSHWRNKENFVKGTWLINTENLPLSAVLIENGTYNRNRLKQRLLKSNILENKCSECGQLPEWNGKPLILQLDHINGVFNDNRLENLRILCGHCHSQTDTFCAKKLKKPNKFCKCGKQISRLSKFCVDCNNKKNGINKTKINWPKVEIILQMVKETSYVKVAKKLGISDSAVRKFIKKNGCEPRFRT